MNLLEMIQGQMDDGVVSQLSKTIRADKDATAAAANGVLATMVTALSKNAAKPDQGQALLNALDRDHDGGILGNLMNVVSGAGSQTSRATNGMGILEHVLGGKTDNVMQMVSKSSGLDLLKTGELMKLLAPVVMGVLGKTKKEQGLDLGGLAGLLSGTVNQAAKGSQEMGMIGKLLDADGDGSIMDDVAGMGMKVLGNMFRKR